MAMPPSTRSNPNPVILAIDQGGHATRAVLFSLSGKKISSAACPIRTLYPQKDHVEHDPEEMVKSVHDSMARAMGNLGTERVVITAAGLATQRSSIVCWNNSTGHALSPVISWRDRRASDWMEKLRPHESSIRERTGLVLSPHYGASKLRWCWDHIPEVRKAFEKGSLAWGPLSSFLLFHLLEERPLLADPANASRTLLWNLRTGTWDRDLLKLFGLPETPLPLCVPTRYNFGCLVLAGERVPLSIVTGDQSAALFAFGPPEKNQVTINIGTGAFLQRPLAKPPELSSNLLCSVGSGDGKSAAYILEGTVNGAGSALGQAARELGVEEKECVEMMSEWLPREEAPPLYLNGVSGLGSPFWVPAFPSRFMGEGSKEAKMAGVLESIVFSIQANLEAMAGVAGAPDRIISTGGLSSLDGLCQRLADLNGLPLLRSVEPEATALGLARLVQGDASQWKEKSAMDRFDPQPSPLLRDRYATWRRAMEDVIKGLE